MIEKKYELIKEGSYSRIKALKDLQLITGEIVKKGDLGGYVHGEHNLSQEGNCWIEGISGAYDNSRVMDNAVLKYCSRSYHNSIVSGNAVMKDFSRAEDNSIISGNAVMQDDSEALNDSIITGNAVLKEHQTIRFGTVTTDLLGTKDCIGALYAELGIKPEKGKLTLCDKMYSVAPNVFGYNPEGINFYKPGDEVILKNKEVITDPTSELFCFTSYGHLNSIEGLFDGDTFVAIEVDIKDIVTVQNGFIYVKRYVVLGNWYK